MLPRQGGGMFGCPTSMRRMWQNFRLRWFVHSFVATEQRGMNLFHRRLEYKSYFVVLDWENKMHCMFVCCVWYVCVVCVLCAFCLCVCVFEYLCLCFGL